MKYIEFSIDKADTLDNVSLNTAYTGAKAEDSQGIYDRVATVDEDNRLLSGFWKNACGQLLDTLRTFVYASDLSDTAFHLTLEVSGNYDDNLTGSLCDDIAATLAAGVTARWFTFTASAKAPEWEEQGRRLLQRVVSKLCHRKRPVRP